MHLLWVLDQAVLQPHPPPSKKALAQGGGWAAAPDDRWMLQEHETWSPLDLHESQTTQASSILCSQRWRWRRPQPLRLSAVAHWAAALWVPGDNIWIRLGAIWLWAIPQPTWSWLRQISTIPQSQQLQWGEMGERTIHIDRGLFKDYQNLSCLSSKTIKTPTWLW